MAVFVSVYDVAAERDSMMRMMYIGKYLNVCQHLNLIMLNTYFR